MSREKRSELMRKKNELIEDNLRKYHPYLWKLKHRQIRNSFLHYSTWLENNLQRGAQAAAAIVIATVNDIQVNKKGPYHTWITVTVDSAIKNEQQGKEILLKLFSGPYGDQGRSTFSSLEPTFVLHERVLLFLRRVPATLWWQGGPGFSMENKDIGLSSYYAEHVKVTDGYYEVSRKYEILPDNKIMIKGKKRLLSSILHEINTA